MERSPIQNHAPESNTIKTQGPTDFEATERYVDVADQSRPGTAQKPVPDSPVMDPDDAPTSDDGSSPTAYQGNGAQGLDVAEDEEIATDDASSSKGSKKRRGWMLGVGAIALIVAAVLGMRWWQFMRTHVSTDNAQVEGHLSPISARVPATVQQVLVQDGDYVEAGQTLLILEDRDLELQVQQAQANLAAAQAQLRAARDTVAVTQQTNPTQVQQAQSSLAARQAAVTAAQASVNQAQAKVASDRAAVTQSQTTVRQTQTDLRRYETLYREGAIPAQQLDTARAASETAQAQLAAANQTVAQAQAEARNAQAQLQAAQAEVEAARGNVAEQQVSGQTVTVQRDQQAQAQAQVTQAEAALALARQQIQYTTIQAPVSGYVGQLTAQVGQKVQIGQPLLSVVPLQTDAVYVDANFKETALGQLQVGEAAAVEVDAYPGETFQATIAGISPATGSSFALLPPDNATGNFNKVVQWVPVRLVFDPDTDPNHRLRPGLSVRVTVDTTTAPGVDLVQPATVTPDSSGANP